MLKRQELVGEEAAVTNDTTQSVSRNQIIDHQRVQVHVVVMKLVIKIRIIDHPTNKAKEDVVTNDTYQIVTMIMSIDRQLI